MRCGVGGGRLLLLFVVAAATLHAAAAQARSRPGSNRCLLEGQTVTITINFHHPNAAAASRAAQPCGTYHGTSTVPFPEPNSAAKHMVTLSGVAGRKALRFKVPGELLLLLLLLVLLLLVLVLLLVLLLVLPLLPPLPLPLLLLGLVPCRAAAAAVAAAAAAAPAAAVTALADCTRNPKSSLNAATNEAGQRYLLFFQRSDDGGSCDGGPDGQLCNGVCTGFAVGGVLPLTAKCSAGKWQFQGACPPPPDLDVVLVTAELEILITVLSNNNNSPGGGVQAAAVLQEDTQPGLSGSQAAALRAAARRDMQRRIARMINRLRRSRLWIRVRSFRRPRLPGASSSIMEAGSSSGVSSSIIALLVQITDSVDRFAWKAGGSQLQQEVQAPLQQLLVELLQTGVVAVLPDTSSTLQRTVGVTVDEAGG
uniref:Pherophorin domain-containing protein n=1 Tax=Tetradesmus obliquus TaxID=3088 RepID=A0A383WLK4_TETOB